MRTYELVLVYDPRVADDEVLSLTGEVRNLLTAKGGVTVTKTDVWGRRRLAYEIQDVNEGKYVVVYFASEAGMAPIAEVERRLQQNDRVLRFLTTRTDEGLKRAGLPIPIEPESEEAVAGIAPRAESEEGGEGGSEPAERPSRPREKPAAAEEAEEPKPARKAKKAEEPEEKSKEPEEKSKEPEEESESESKAAAEESKEASEEAKDESKEASEEAEEKSKEAGEAEASGSADEKKEEG